MAVHAAAASSAARTILVMLPPLRATYLSFELEPGFAHDLARVVERVGDDLAERLRRIADRIGGGRLEALPHLRLLEGGDEGSVHASGDRRGQCGRADEAE